MLDLGIVVLILGIAFFQTVHGLFSSLIMALCTLVCTVVAFNYYELLASTLYEHQPAYADAGALIALLVIPLLVIRFAVDNYLPGNVLPNVWVDRVGGAAFGVITGLLLIGTLLIAVQMLPFERSILGYDPFDDDLKPADSLAVDAPGFTLGVVKILSGGSLAGSRNFAEVHENLPLELWAARNRMSGSRNDAVPKAFKVQSIHDVTELTYPGKESTAGETFDRYAPAHPGTEDQKSQVIVARVLVTEDARDHDGWWRLTGTQFRLVTAEGKGYYPVGYLINMGQWGVFTEPVGKLQINRPGSKAVSVLNLDLMYRVPLTADEKPAELSYLAFRRAARSEIPGKIAADMPPTKGALKRREVFGEVDVELRAGVLALFRPRKAIVNPAMPASFRNQMASRGQTRVNLSEDGTFIKVTLLGSRMTEGEIKGDESKMFTLAGGGRRESGTFVRQFFEPPNQKVVKLVGDRVTTNVLTKITSVLSQPRVVLLNGEEKPVVGAWVRWTEGGKKMIHMYYATSDPDADMADIREIADRKFLSEDLKRVVATYRANGRSVSEFGFIFLVPDNAKISGFRLTGKDLFSCESPLSTSRPPRASRRRPR